jgi:DNA-binding XRE family transcriptional regulator
MTFCFSVLFAKVVNYGIHAIILPMSINSLCAMKSQVKKKKRAPKRYFDEAGLKAFASHLKEVRKEKKFTQEELAYESDITLSQIARIETAKINPTLSTIFRIARTLEVPVSRLFEFKLPAEPKGK